MNCKHMIYNKMPLVLSICGAVVAPVQIFIEVLIPHMFSQGLLWVFARADGFATYVATLP